MILKINGVQQAASWPEWPKIDLNPFDDVARKLDELNRNIETAGDAFVYWINPVNWVQEGWQALEALVLDPGTATWIMAGTVVGIWLIMFGARWPKKWIFWGWIVYWTLRGFIFV
jgi:hypothetical protein